MKYMIIFGMEFISCRNPLYSLYLLLVAKDDLIEIFIR